MLYLGRRQKLQTFQINRNRGKTVTNHFEDNMKKVQPIKRQWHYLFLRATFMFLIFSSISIVKETSAKSKETTPTLMPQSKNAPPQKANTSLTSEKKQPERQMQLGSLKPAKTPKKEAHVIMDDIRMMSKKWDLEKIKVQSAWLQFSQGNREIVVAVIDTGIDVNHEDLKDNIWKNPKEIPGNNIDDDNNGYVDDVHGWNFVRNDNKVSDNHGHGTHIAGIIGAVGGNNIGISGVAPKVSLMALKYYDPTDTGTNNLNNTIKAIDYAVKNGAHIINYSGGGLDGNLCEKMAIRRAEEKGILFVAAAGNERSNTDKSGYYPANYSSKKNELRMANCKEVLPDLYKYDKLNKKISRNFLNDVQKKTLSNILPVTATDPSDKVLKSSNWGESTVHKSAPGINILSTLPNGKYGRMTGTSQATAVATGSAVLIMDYYKNQTARFVIKHLTMTGDIKDSLKGKTSQRRRLNIIKALQTRGKKLNFKDQVVDAKGRVFPSDGNIDSSMKAPLEQERAEIQMIHNIMNIGNQKKIGTQNRETATEKKARTPSSADTPSSAEQKKTPFLKRWFFNKK